MDGFWGDMEREEEAVRLSGVEGVKILNVFCLSRLNVLYEDKYIYEGRLKIWWTHLIIPSRNFLEVR
jgi:hypothetical protein